LAQDVAILLKLLGAIQLPLQSSLMLADRRLLNDIWKVLESGDLCALQAITPEGFAWHSARCPHSGVTPLQEVVKSVSNIEGRGDGFVHVAKWLMDHGACPLQRASSDASGCECRSESSTIRMQTKERSALSLAAETRKHMTNDWDEHDGCPWPGEIAFLERIIKIFSEEKRTNCTINRTVVSTSVVERWASLLHDTSEHDVTINAQDGSCGARGSLLMRASPVVQASLSSAMLEGASRSIALPDCTLAAVHLLLELVYTGGISEDATAKTANQALELAHRWQVDDVVQMIKKFIMGLLTDETFEEIATSAQLLGLPRLRQACVDFAEASSAVQEKVKSKVLPAAVLILLGMTTDRNEPPKKMRRML